MCAADTGVRVLSRHCWPIWRPSPFYGWRIVALSAVTLMLTGPGQTLGMSVFVEEIIRDLGIERSEVSLAYLIATLTGAAALPLVGRGIDRYGVRSTMTLIGLAFAAAIAGLAGVVGFASMVVGFIGLRMLGQGALTLTATTAVGLWFEERRGMALGITTAVGAGLMSVVPIILTALVTALGWREALLVAGPTVGALVVLIARLGMRDGPHELGLGLDGRALESHQQRGGETGGVDWPVAAESRAVESRAWSANESIQTLMFWALALAFASPSMIGTGLVFHQISVLGEQGLTPTQSAAAFVPYSLAAMGATFVAGAVADRLRPEVLVALPLVMLLSAMHLVSFVMPGLLVVLYAGLLGGASGSLRSLEPALMAKFYGLAHIGSIRGRMMSIKVGASALGPYALAIGFEHFGAYQSALRVLTIVPAAALLFVVLAPYPNSKSRER